MYPQDFYDFVGIPANYFFFKLTEVIPKKKVWDYVCKIYFIITAYHAIFSQYHIFAH